MKKKQKTLLALLLATGLISLPAASQAVDFKVKGTFDITFETSNAAPRGVNKADTFAAFQRWRLQMDAVASENLSGSVMITVGSGSKIGALAVVLKAVPPNCTVVGNPGRIVRREGVAPQIDLDHVHLPDPIREHIVALERRVSELEEQMHNHYGTTVFKEDIQDDADL